MNIDEMDTNAGGSGEFSKEENMRREEMQKIKYFICFILESFKRGESLRIVREKDMDIDLSNQLSGIVSTVFNYLRKKSNTNQNRAGNNFGDKTAVLYGQTRTISSLGDEYIIQPDYKAFIYIIATPLINLMTSFKLVYDEVRVSSAKFKIKSGERGPPVEKSITAYGLSNVHLPLLRGITFKPERRSAMIRNLGTMTLCIMLLHEKNYTNKLEEALKYSLGMLPMADAIIQLLKTTTVVSNAHGLLRNLADFLLITGDRRQGRMHFPLLYFLIAPNITDFSFSGRSGMLHYMRTIMDGDIKWSMNSGGIVEKIQQVVFHSMFETSLDDLGILGVVTNVNSWFKRSEISEVFKKGDKKFFSPVKWLKYSKMAQASMTKLHGTILPMLTAEISKTGHRKRSFTAAFLNYLETGNNQVAFGLDANSLSYAISQLKVKALKMMKETGGDKAGTTSWYSMNSEGVEVEHRDFVAQETGLYFYS